MDTWFSVFEECKRLVGLTEQDGANVTRLREILTPEIQGITDRFYEVLLREPGTKHFVEGRVDRLKQTHLAWFRGILEGSYDRDFFDRQFQIGLAHVRISLPPQYVESIMAIVRADAFGAIIRKAGDAREASGLVATLTKLLDLDLIVINLSYHETRLTKLTAATGMSRKLLENLIFQG